jgi:rod shape determining protein RodA
MTHTMSTQGRVKRRDMNAAWRHVDFVLIALVVVASLFGAVLVYSATRNRPNPNEFIIKHLVYLAVGGVAFAAAAAVSYQRLRDLSLLIYGGMLVVLGLVLVPGIGAQHKNIRAWFDIGPIQIQPAELAKLAVILVLAAYLGNQLDRGEVVGIRALVVTGLIFAGPVGLIMLQPDLGTALVFIAIVLFMLSVSGLQGRYLLVIALVGLGGVVGVLQSNVLDQYQKDRLTAFVNPQSVSEKIIYNTRQAQSAVASGSITGQGLFRGAQTKGRFVPEQQTDFIFTVVGEELGFLGSAALLLLQGGICYRVWRTAQLSGDALGRLICAGVLGMLTFHIFENVGMAIGIMPVTGIPLPFTSYGGSATIATMAAMGLVMNVHMRRYV